MEYKFREIEQKWQQYWAENNTYKATEDSSKPKYYVLDMFPYPSGAGLHVGHPLGYIASDIFARYKRAKGFNVLHPMGFDAFGLPAEQYAIETGQHPAETTKQNIKRYKEQLTNIGFSFDWSRQVITSDPSYYKWTQWIFLKLFNSWYNKETGKAESIETLINQFKTKGREGYSSSEWKGLTEKEQQKILMKYRLAFLDYADVNWCPVLGTVLANDEVKDGKSERGGHPVVRKSMRQWFLRITSYADRLLRELENLDWPESIKDIQRNWIGRSEGAVIQFNLIPSLSPKEKGVQVLSHGEDLDEVSREALPQYTTDAKTWHHLKPLARENRKKQTDAENVLWETIRNRKLGDKFRRQHAIEKYIVDFVCIEKKLIIEIDGEIHNYQLEEDKARAEALQEEGFKVIRFTNKEVLQDIESVLLQVKKQLDLIPSLSPKEKGEEVLSRGEDLGEVNRVNEFQIPVFTTRPDTIFGSTFIVLAPEHTLVSKITSSEQKEEVEKYLEYVKTRSERERLAEVKKITGAFTGAYVAHPFTGEQLPVWISEYVLAGYGTGAIMAVPGHDSRDYAFAKHFDLPIKEVVAGGDISKEAFESKTGKIINSDFITGLEVKEAISKMIGEIEQRGLGKKQINYRLRDAAFSRQRYWGEPFPVYYKDDIPYPLNESELPLELPKIDTYKPTESGDAPLARAANWKTKEGYPLETDTMPGYAGSSWYFLRYMDPHNENEFVSKEKEQYWQNVDLYMGGAEHATGHLLYARLWMHFLYDIELVTKKEPFQKMINQGMILGENNEKMSKSRGNVVNPDDVIARYGTDTFRIYEMFLGPIEQSKPWDTQGIDGSHRFLKKFWRLFYNEEGMFSVDNAAPNAEELKTLHKTIKKITEDIERFSFNTAVSTFMICVNELSALKCNNKSILQELVILLAPFAPHVCEEIWKQIGNNNSVTQVSFPAFNEEYLKENTVNYPIAINGKIRAQMEVSADLPKNEVEEKALGLETIQKWLEGAQPKKVIVVPGKMVNVVV